MVLITQILDFYLMKPFLRIVFEKIYLGITLLIQISMSNKFAALSP